MTATDLTQSSSIRKVSYIGVTAVVLLVWFLLPFFRDAVLVPKLGLLTFIVALTALFVASLLLVGYYTQQDSMYLIVSLAFIGAGLLDVYQALALGAFGVDSSVTPWLVSCDWPISTALLALGVAVSWLRWRRQQANGRFNKLALLIIGTMLGYLFLMSIVPMTAQRLRPLTAVASMLLLGASWAGYYLKNKWPTDIFERWFMLSIWLLLVAHLLFLPIDWVSVAVRQTAFVLLQEEAYLFVLVGLLLGIISMYRQSERTAVKFLNANAALQREIAERQRAEMVAETAAHQFAQLNTELQKRIAERTADLSLANAELARAGRLKDEFLASISHELRTPLNAILGISQALQEEVYGSLNEKQIGSLVSIEESGRHLLSLITDILDLSKVEAGKLELEIRPFAIKSVCEASLRLIKQNAHDKNITIHAAYDPDVDVIRADERRVKQILVNLLSNAVKFTLSGDAIGLDVAGDAANKLVHITVWDTGIGIAPEDISRLFRPFVQLDSSLSREYAGTGLGLSLVYRMVELHGGSVAVESEPERGSRFTVSLPWNGANNSYNPMDEAELVAADAPHLHAIRKALIIEDSPTTIARLIRYLGEMGIETVVYRQGYGAVEKAIIEQPDVIILDTSLPDISGMDLLRQLQADMPTRQIPVLVTSVLDDMKTAVALGATDTLQKPINRQQLQRALRHTLMRRMQNRLTWLITGQKDE